MRKAFWIFLFYTYLIILLVPAIILYCFKIFEWIVYIARICADKLYNHLENVEHIFKNKINRA